MTVVKREWARVMSALALLALVGCRELSPATSKPRGNSGSPVALLLEQMASDDLTDRRLAQVHLAYKGEEALAALSAACDADDERLKQSIREVVALMLLNSVEYEKLWKYPRLVEVCRPKFDEAREFARLLAGAEDYDSGEHGMGPGLPPPPSPDRQALYALIGLHGWAVPAAIELCTDDMPASRLYGAEVLRLVEAWVQKDVWELLLQDRGPVTIFRGCFDEPTTVAGAASDWLRFSSGRRDFDNPNVPRYAARTAWRYLLWLGQFDKEGPASPTDTTLANVLSQRADTMAAESWDDYWDRAEPVLRDVWRE